MAVTKDEAKAKAAELIKKYEILTSKRLNAEATKQGSFKALGWNVEDSANEVLPQEASKGRVDYSFKLRGWAVLTH